MPEVYSDNNGQRVVTRHRGPVGPGLPPGGTAGQIYVKASNNDYDGAWANPPDGTGAVVGPIAGATDGAFVLFDGTTGALVKDSTKTLSYFATKAYADSKVDKETGLGLSETSFTTAEKAKLAALGDEHFLGVFGAIDDAPVGAEGAYAVIENMGETALFYFWDATNATWTRSSDEALTGGDIATLLFKDTDAGAYDQTTCRIFTTAEKDKLAEAVTLTYLGTVLTGAGITAPAYGTVNFFNLTPISVVIGGISDGLTNMVKIAATTTLASDASSFDAGASTSRLRYTNTSTRLFRVEAVLSVDGASTDVLVFAIAKNGSVVSTSRVIKKMGTGGEICIVPLSEVLSLASNDYVEVFVGNTSDTSAPDIYSLKLSAVTL